MALVLGTNCGFVATAPTADPAGSNTFLDNVAQAGRFTSPATATKVIEIGWYCDNATQAANFDVAIYADDGADFPQGVVGSISADNAKGTGAGWKSVAGLNITISPSTVYWIGVQLDDTATGTRSNNTVDASHKKNTTGTGKTALEDPWPSGGTNTAAILAFYAVWEAAAISSANLGINIGDDWKEATEVYVNVGDAWKAVTEKYINIGDTWKAVAT